MILRVFASTPRAGLLAGKIAVGIGIALPVLFLPIEGNRIYAVAYLILATPILPGCIAFAINPTRRTQIVASIMLASLSAAAVIGLARSWHRNDLPPGATAEEPLDYRNSPHALARDPFGQPPAVDVDGNQLFQPAKNPVDQGTTVSADLPFLRELSGPNRELLLRHLATSAEWFLGKKTLDGEDILVAQRRFVEDGLWRMDSFGEAFNGDGEYGIEIGIGRIDGDRWAGWHGSNTFAELGQKAVPLTLFPDSMGDNDSYLIVTSDAASLQIHEMHRRKDRPFTCAAVLSLENEFMAVLSSPTAKARRNCLPSRARPVVGHEFFGRIKHAEVALV